MYSTPLPPTPPDTARAAEAAFGKRNAYIVLGDEANHLYADLDLSCLYPQEGITRELPYRLAFVTIFQYHEGITDRQAADATRMRVDWKYALHLPMTFPGLRAMTLCDFRQRLLAKDDAKEAFQQLLTRLSRITTWRDRPSSQTDANSLLQSVCMLTRMELVASTMQSAITSLVATRHEWLRSIIPSHWYQRYSKNLLTLRGPDDLESQVKLAESIGADGLYLLKAIEQTDSSTLSAQPEIRRLEQLWKVEFELQNGVCRWRTSCCANAFDPQIVEA